MVTKEVAIRGETALTEHDEKQFSSAIAVTPEYISQTKKSLALLRNMVQEVLVEGVDYGFIEGVPEEFLWDPGASQIVGSFNSRFGPPRIVSQTMTDTLIAVVVDQPIISFQSGQEVASCIGAASTSEVKHKYRWVPKWELADWGYTEEAVIKTLKTKLGKDNKQYKFRIPNPEPGELLNVIWKMACKRGRVGAAKLLPGVSSALAEKFAAAKPPDGRGKKQPQKPTSDWDIFWAKTKQMGLEADQVHSYLKVKSLKEWVATGQTLDQAINALVQAMADKGAQKTGQQAPPPGDMGDDGPPPFDENNNNDLGDLGPDPLDPPPAAAAAPQYKTDPATLKSLGDFYTAVFRDFPVYRFKLEVLTALRKKEAQVNFIDDYKKLAEINK